MVWIWSQKDSGGKNTKALVCGYVAIRFSPVAVTDSLVFLKSVFFLILSFCLLHQKWCSGLFLPAMLKVVGSVSPSPQVSGAKTLCPLRLWRH